MNPLIKLNVGGKIFETYLSTLNKSEYFKNMFVDNLIDIKEEIFINRSSKIFKHVLAYLIDDQYPYPKVYTYELDFYLIFYNVHDRISKTIAKRKIFFCEHKSIFGDVCDELCVNSSDYCLQHINKKRRKTSKYTQSIEDNFISRIGY